MTKPASKDPKAEEYIAWAMMMASGKIADLADVQRLSIKHVLDRMRQAEARVAELEKNVELEVGTSASREAIALVRVAELEAACEAVLTDFDATSGFVAMKDYFSCEVDYLEREIVNPG